MSVSRGPDGKFYGQFGLSSHQVPPAGTIPAKLRNAALAELGHLWLVKHGGSVRDVSDVGDQDWTWTSTRVNLAPKDFPDANPGGLAYRPGHALSAAVSRHDHENIFPDVNKAFYTHARVSGS